MRFSLWACIMCLLAEYLLKKERLHMGHSAGVYNMLGFPGTGEEIGLHIFVLRLRETYIDSGCLLQDTKVLMIRI